MEHKPLSVLEPRWALQQYLGAAGCAGGGGVMLGVLGTPPLVSPSIQSWPMYLAPSFSFHLKTQLESNSSGSSPWHLLLSI